MDFKYITKPEYSIKKDLIKKRDLSIIEFQIRLLDLAKLDKTPDMEKLNFVKIISSNLEEFISVRLPNIEEVDERSQIIHLIESIFDVLGSIVTNTIQGYPLDIFCNRNFKKVVPHRNFRYIYSGETQNEVIKDLLSSLEMKKHVKSVTILCENIDKITNCPVIRVPAQVLDIERIIESLKPMMDKSAYYNNKPIRYDRNDYYEVLQKKDVLIRTPYDDYQTVLDFIDQMCTSTEIQSVFITLYRTAEHSKIVQSLVKAADSGKRVFVFIEPTARDNEQLNLDNIKALKRSNVCVRYNYFNYKVHGKMFLAVDKNWKLFAHIGTGNYNEKTEKFYTDFHLLTTNYSITSELLNILMCMFKKKVFKTFITKEQRIFASPLNFRSKIMDLIDDEIKKGDDGRIWIKCNNICDKQVIAKLYHAADAGVDVRVITRTGCSIYPYKDNVTIKSKVGQYLEHDRFYIFGYQYFISSGDLLLRNLSKRIELLCEITSIENQVKIEKTFLNLWTGDIHVLQKDGRWKLELAE